MKRCYCFFLMIFLLTGTCLPSFSRGNASGFGMEELQKRLLPPDSVHIHNKEEFHHSEKHQDSTRLQKTSTEAQNKEEFQKEEEPQKQKEQQREEQLQGNEGFESNRPLQNKETQDAVELRKREELRIREEQQGEEAFRALEDPRNKPQIRLAGNRLIIENLPEDDVLEIYNIMGVKVYNRRIKAGTNQYPLSLQRGYYIIKVGKLTRKIAIK